MLNINSVYFYIFIIFIIIFQTYGNNITSNLNIKINETINNTNKNIPSEGGVIVISEKNYTNKIENTLTKPVVNISSNITTSIKNTTISQGREGVKTTTTIFSTPTKNSSMSTIHVTLKSTTSEKIIPVSESDVPISINMTNNQSSTTEKIEVIGDSKIKPRKGAPEYIPENFTSTTTTRKPRKMKPTVTVGSDDDGNVPFVGHRNSKKDNSSILKTEGILSGKYKPDYVLPIVMTILAVPLVAIILAVLYKRGAEWWQHRHYRRMDFLIDGMYNN